MADDLRAFGVDPAAVEAWQETQSREIEVLDCNREIVGYFSCVSLSYLPGFERATCLGISMVEIHAMFEVLAVERARWPEIGAGLLLMGRAAARVINQRD